jgi:hypothetical protein
LRERIGQHVAVWRGVQHIGAAILLAKIHVLCPDIKQEHVFTFDRVG